MLRIMLLQKAAKMVKLTRSLQTRRNQELVSRLRTPANRNPQQRRSSRKGRRGNLKQVWFPPLHTTPWKKTNKQLFFVNWTKSVIFLLLQDGSTLMTIKTQTSTSQVGVARSWADVGVKSLSFSLSYLTVLRWPPCRLSSGLPPDISPDEFAQLMSKGGIVMRDPLTEEYKVKLYKDKEGNLKGDGLCCYLKASLSCCSLQYLLCV